MSFLHDTYEDFYKYFNTHYNSNNMSMGYLLPCKHSSKYNMYTESFHRSLKVVYLNNKQNRSVDYWYLPMFTPVYLCFPILHLFTYVYLCSPIFTTVYLCMFTYVYTSLLLLTFVYLCLPMFTTVYLC